MKEQQGVLRKPRKGEAVRRRVHAFLQEDEAPSSPNVQPLNRGFFSLERMRHRSVSKRSVKGR